MDHTVQVITTRDRKERKLFTIEEQMKAQELTRIKMQTHFDKELVKYQEWKKEHNINGIKY